MVCPLVCYFCPIPELSPKAKVAFGERVIPSRVGEYFREELAHKAKLRGFQEVDLIENSCIMLPAILMVY